MLALGELRKEIAALTEGSQSIANAALEAEGASREAQKGAEIISSAAEEQAAASTEALRSVEQQTTALDECQSATQSVAAMANKIGTESSAGGRGSTGFGRRAIVVDCSGNFRRGIADHGGGRADRPRRTAAGGGHPASQRRDGADREDGRGGKGERREVARTDQAERDNARGNPPDDFRFVGRRRALARNHAPEPGADCGARGGQPQRRQDRRRHRHGIHSDQHAGGQRLGRSRARRRSR